MSAVVSMPPVDMYSARPGSAKGADGGATASATPLSARGPASGFSHLSFDSTRTYAGAADKAAERDRLRNKLVDVGRNFVGFDKVIETDTIARRQQEVKKLEAAQGGLLTLEKALNSEIKRRVEANKMVQSLTEQLANDMLERLQSTILVRVEKLASSIETLTLRCTALEKGISQFRGELPSKLQVDTAALVKEIS
jgi:hypothetical protein